MIWCSVRLTLNDIVHRIARDTIFFGPDFGPICPCFIILGSFPTHSFFHPQFIISTWILSYQHPTPLHYHTCSTYTIFLYVFSLVLKIRVFSNSYFLLCIILLTFPQPLLIPLLPTICVNISTVYLPPVYLTFTYVLFLWPLYIHPFSTESFLSSRFSSDLQLSTWKIWS